MKGNTRSGRQWGVWLVQGSVGLQVRRSVLVVAARHSAVVSRTQQLGVGPEQAVLSMQRTSSPDDELDDIHIEVPQAPRPASTVEARQHPPVPQNWPR